MILRNFVSMRVVTVYMENLVRFEISLRSIWPKWNLPRSKFHSAWAIWTLIRKLPSTGMKFYPEVKSQTSLSPFRVSCKRALDSYSTQGYGRLWCSILVIKKAVRFKVPRSLPEEEDDSGINSVFFKTNY